MVLGAALDWMPPFRSPSGVRYWGAGLRVYMGMYRFRVYMRLGF